MNAIGKALAVCAMAIGMALPTAGTAQSTVDHSKMDMSKMTSLTDGEIRKVDLDAGKVTIRHGEIRHLDMPPMTMVFTARDKSLLANLKAGDKVRFMAASEGGKMLVTEIHPARP